MRNAAHEFVAIVRGARRRLRIEPESDAARVTVDGSDTPLGVRWLEAAPGEGCIVVDGRPFDVNLRADGDGRYRVSLLGREIDVAIEHGLTERTRRGDAGGGGRARGPIEIRSPMHGLIVHIHVREGDVVERDAPLFVLEAMKMQNAITAPEACVVRRVLAEPGQTVEGEALLAVLEPHSTDSVEAGAVGPEGEVAS